jgi:cellulose biosynthesis protein BcsQ
MTQNWDDLNRDLARARPDALIIDGSLAPDPESLRDMLVALPPGMVALVVLPAMWANRQGIISAVSTSVRGVFIGPGVNWMAIADATRTAVMTARVQARDAAPAAAVYRDPQAARVSGQVVVGTRIVAFISFAGGTGKSSIAEAMAVVLASNHVRTLLCSFNSPPAASPHLGLNLMPNATEWFNRPTVEGFQASLQHPKGLDDLDVLLAPNNNVTNTEAAARRPDDTGSIKNLVLSAYSFNYGAILLDLPPFADPGWTLRPLMAANMAVIVCRPTLHDQMAAVRAYEMLTLELRDEIRIPSSAVYAAINFVSPNDNMSERDFQSQVAEQLSKTDKSVQFPPIMAGFPYTPALPGVQNFGRSPVFDDSCSEFARSARSLTAKLVGGGLGASGESSGNGREKKSGLLSYLGINLKVK